jgi:hypothetical protein
VFIEERTPAEIFKFVWLKISYIVIHQFSPIILSKVNHSVVY